MSQPSSRGRMTLCPRLEIGKSSEKPCRRPSTIACPYEISDATINASAKRAGTTRAASASGGSGDARRADHTRAVARAVEPTATYRARRHAVFINSKHRSQLSLRFALAGFTGVRNLLLSVLTAAVAVGAAAARPPAEAQAREPLRLSELSRYVGFK